MCSSEKPLQSGNAGTTDTQLELLGVSLILRLHTLSLKRLMTFAASLLLSSISLCSSSLALLCCSHSSSLLSRSCSSIVSFTSSCRWRSSWKNNFFDKAKKDTDHVYINVCIVFILSLVFFCLLWTTSQIFSHTKHHCPFPLLYLLSSLLLLLLFFIPPLLFLPFLHSSCCLDPLLLSPWTDEDKTKMTPKGWKLKQIFICYHHLYIRWPMIRSSLGGLFDSFTALASLLIFTHPFFYSTLLYLGLTCVGGPDYWPPSPSFQPPLPPPDSVFWIGVPGACWLSIAV